MSAATRFSLVVLLGLLVVALLPAEPPMTPPTKEQCAQWVKDLGNDDFDKREEASKKLWEAGPVAEDALQGALKSNDEEVRRRAKELLEKFKLGIYPGTPQKVVDLIHLYQTADPNTRGDIIRQLLESGSHGCRALMKLVNAEEDKEVRRSAAHAISFEMNRAAPSLILEGNYDMLEMVLDIGLANNEGKTDLSNYCAYYLLRGKLDTAIDKVKSNKEFNDKRKQEMLAYLYRAKGDLKAARAAANKAEQEELADGLLYEAADWVNLAKHFQNEKLLPPLPTLFMAANAPRGSPTGVGDGIRLAAALAPLEYVKDAKDIEKLGYGATYQRLAGNKIEFDARIAAILKYAAEASAGDRPLFSFYAAKALFMNDKPELAMKVLKDGGRPDMVFEILCMQLRFSEAFELLEQVRKNGEKESLPFVEILAARTLYALGETDKAKTMFAKLGESIKLGKDLSWFDNLVDAEARVGLRDEAFEHAGTIIEQSKDAGWPARLFPKLFPGHADTAEVWFQFLRANSNQKETLPALEHLKKIRALLDGKTPEKDLRQLLTDAEAVAHTKNGEELDRWILALADTALECKQNEMALALLEKTKTHGALRRLGDLYADKKQWNKAAEQYKAAWEAEKQQPLPLYLYGQALAKSGKEAEGKKLMEQAHWLPLGDEAARFAFVAALVQRGQVDAARRENDLLLHTSQPASYYTGEALRRTALEALAKKDYLQAAAGHEMAMFRCLKTFISFLQSGAYVGVPAHVHRLRARGLLEAGKLAEAKREIAAAQLLLPGDIELAILLVPALEKRGQVKEAKELFDKTLGIYEKVCQDYPRCSWAHNSAAWLSACCGRNLQAAKEHALKAVDLAPTNAGYIDTLAETYFQLGDKDKAIATQKKAIELDSKKVYFRKQLQRIEAGDPKAERPPENEDDD